MLHISFFLFLSFFVFKFRFSNLTCYTTEDDHELFSASASTSRVLGLLACATSSGAGDQTQAPCTLGKCQ